MCRKPTPIDVDDPDGFLRPEHDERNYVNRLAELTDPSNRYEPVVWRVSVYLDESGNFIMLEVWRPL